MDGARGPAPSGSLRVALLAAVLCLVPIWSVHFLPMVDLPQHAAQVALWTHHDDPRFWPPDVYRFNWLTPYVGSYLVARAFALVVSVPIAMKLTVSLAVIGLPFAALALVRATGGERTWALAAVPLAFGVSFYGGFLSFLFALPVAVLALTATVGLARDPTRRRAVRLAALFFVLAACHAVAYGLGAFVAFGILWADAEGFRGAIRKSLPIGLPMPFVVAWAVLTWRAEAHVRTPLSWANPGTRLLTTPATLLGTNQAIAFLVAFSVLAAILASLGVRLRFTRTTAVALLAAGGAYLAAPDGAFHTVLLPERFAALLAVIVLPALRMPQRPLARRAVAGVLVAVVVGWSVYLTVQFRRFDREMSGFADLVAKMEPGKIVRVVTVDSGSESIPGYPIFWNVGGWYQVEKGGLVGFSFSQLFPSLVRYRSTPAWAEPLLAPRGEIRWRPEDASFHYFVFRSLRADPAGQFPVEAGTPALLARSGAWWLYAAPSPIR